MAITTFAAVTTSDAQARYASMVVDAETGQVLHAVNADTRNYPASLTKIMTLYMVFDALEKGKLTLKQKLKVSKRASGMPPSKLGLKAGETITVEQAIRALSTKSANDVAVVVAEALAGKETTFAQVMTKRARTLGMSRTTFRNASGLPNRAQKSTARDMTRLAKALMADFPQYYHYFSVGSFTYKGRTHRSHNKLLKTYKGTDGIKTGYIRASGFNLVASVERSGRRVIAVVFGGKTSKSRDRHMVKLLDRGFKKLASQGIRKIPQIPGRNPFQKPMVTLEIAGAGAKQPAPVETAAAVPAARSHAIKPVMPSSQVATADSMEMPVEAESLTNDWIVQVGAFSRFRAAHSSAKSALDRAPKELQGAKVAIQRVDTSSLGTLYRSQLTGLYEQQAREACQTLVAAEMNCVVMQPEAQGSN
ncbi:D-alanyl-D-alanine carboxypeptidase family protein [Pelagibius litoralis]|uniref:D-alanyl-D-alanine carboxypeptidase family protein n=1 Tax=Pelagibius litoralis TaxID=374515 RepID=UPI001F11446A|nr:D-alanyl-D-alanine carboxypeptidase family protein [Pelagibius litoralis]